MKAFVIACTGSIGLLSGILCIVHGLKFKSEVDDYSVLFFAFLSFLVFIGALVLLMDAVISYYYNKSHE